MSSEQHSETDRPQTQEKQSVWAWIKSRIIAFMEHRYFDKIVAIVELLLTAVGGFSLGSWYTSTSETSGANSPSVSGDHNNVSTTTINNTTINKTVIVNSKEEAEEDLFRTMGKETVDDEKSSAIESETPVLQLLNSSKLDFLADNAFNAWKRMDFSNAVMNAQCANELIMGKLPADGRDYNIYIESNVWRNVQRVYPILIDDAMSNADYDGMLQMADVLISSSPSYWAYPRAIKDIALLRKSGCRLFFFSPEKIRELRAMPKNDLEQYLTTLTTRGYLVPYFLNYQQQDVEPVEWGRFFDLGHPLPYLHAFRVRTKDADGNEITSNELYGQWIGFGKYELIDVNAEAARSIGLSESQIPHKPIQVTGMITRGRPSAVAFVDEERMKVPEPSSGMLLIIGLATLALHRRT